MKLQVGNISRHRPVTELLIIPQSRLKAFGEWLLFVEENAEIVYFVLWYARYTQLMNNTKALLKPDPSHLYQSPSWLPSSTQRTNRSHLLFKRKTVSTSPIYPLTILALPILPLSPPTLRMVLPIAISPRPTAPCHHTLVRRSLARSRRKPVRYKGNAGTALPRQRSTSNVVKNYQCRNGLYHMWNCRRHRRCPCRFPSAHYGECCTVNKSLV